MKPDEIRSSLHAELFGAWLLITLLVGVMTATVSSLPFFAFGVALAVICAVMAVWHLRDARHWRALESEGTPLITFAPDESGE